jgi:hypothetical protein
MYVLCNIQIRGSILLLSRAACCFLALPFISIIRCASLIFGILYSNPRAAISLRNPGSFYWKMVLVTNRWVLGVLIASGLSLLPKCLSGQSSKYVCVLIHICTEMCKYFCIYPSLSILS